MIFLKRKPVWLEQQGGIRNIMILDVYADPTFIEQRQVSYKIGRLF